MSARPGMPVGVASMGPAATDPLAPSPSRALSEHRIIGPDDEPTAAATLLVNSVSLAISKQGSVAVLTVQNNNVGHAFPSGSRFAREVWIEWSEQLANGSWEVRSGALLPPGGFVQNESIPRIEFHDALSTPLATEATITAVRAIESGQSREFSIPVRAGTTALRARLRYRAQSFALLEVLNVLHALSPPIEIATAEIPW